MKNILTIIIALSLLSSASLFSSGSGEKQVTTYSGTEGRITVYVSGPENMLNKLEEVFESTEGDVLDLVQMGCGPLRQRIWTEYESGGIQADVFWGSDPLIYNALDAAGALEPYTPREADMLKPEFVTGHDYTLINERYGVVIYNREKLSGSKPSGYAALLDPGYRDRMVHADPTQSSTALALIGGLRELMGNDWNYHRNLVDNGLFLARKNSDVPSKIQEGEFDAGIAPHDAVLRLQKKAKKEGYPITLAICWPEEGAIAIQRPLAISKNPMRPEENSRIAQSFADFMLSKKAQQITVQFGFVSVRRDLPATPGIPDDIPVYRVDWDSLSEKQYAVRSGFSDLFE
ncbi:extracellular solute-binding protein [Marispirochaeta sp.]|uniref:ABC transporter substrate-binding protein n=1 Tax=Marispirochaeta sp. TaxID=2038653 RepID=UPI0029C7A8AE|nr:extracellular solute-binding protein [Marispirochaeta sp.]